MEIFLTKFKFAKRARIEILWVTTLLAIGVQIYLTNHNYTRPHGLMVRENPSGNSAHSGAIVKLVPLETESASSPQMAKESSLPVTLSVPMATVPLDSAIHELGDLALTLPAARHWLSLSGDGENQDKKQGVEFVKAIPTGADLPFELRDQQVRIPIIQNE